MGKKRPKKENGRGSVEEKKDESKSSLSLSGSVCHQSYFPPFIQFALSSSSVVSILDSSVFSASAKLDKVFTMRAKILHVLRFLAHPELGILASLCMHSEIVVVVCLPCLPGKKAVLYKQSEGPLSCFEQV